MNKKESKKFEKLLMSERDRLSTGLQQIQEDTLYESSSGNTGDLTSYAEVGTENFERETALNIASGETQRLREVSEALQRIQGGNYGICEGCEKEIPRKRLEVFPAARYCVECQAKLERDGTL
jgi:DnaK suppressor protein